MGSSGSTSDSGPRGQGFKSGMSFPVGDDQFLWMGSSATIQYIIIIE
jgi:hypothetical protein